MSNKFFHGLPIYYINLKRSRRRNIDFQRGLKKCGIKQYKRIDAIDGKKHKLSVVYQPHHVEFFTNGLIACTFSYLKLLNEFLENEKSDFIVMCDDDVDFSNSLKISFNFYESLELHNPDLYNLRLMAMDWDPNVKGSDGGLKPNYGPSMFPVAKLFKPDINPWGQATIINKNWAEYFLKKFDAYKQKIDHNYIYNPISYKENLNDSFSWFKCPAIDAINCDDNVYLWRIFTCMEEGSDLISNDENYETAVNYTTNFYVNKYFSENYNLIKLDSFIMD